jgi:hypothetical protein
LGTPVLEHLNCGDVSLAPDPGKVYGIAAIELAADIIEQKSAFASCPVLKQPKQCSVLLALR